MIASPDKKSLYVIGGYGQKKEVYKYTCSSNISTCTWSKTATELTHGRYAFVAIPIPNYLAVKVC